MNRGNMKTYSYNVLLVAEYFSVYTHVYRTEIDSHDDDDIIDEALEMMRKDYGLSPKLFQEIELLDSHEVEDTGAA
jgi:hypothetical protein